MHHSILMYDEFSSPIRAWRPKDGGKLLGKCTPVSIHCSNKERGEILDMGHGDIRSICFLINNTFYDGIDWKSFLHDKK